VSERFDEALRDIETVVAGEGTPRNKLRQVANLVRAANPLYSWVGLYYLRGEVLELGPFSGLPTSCTRIAVGKGVCGTAVQQRKNQVIHDVHQIDNYLACSPAVRSELVVLIWRGHEILGEIDVDSDELAAFTPADERFLDQVAALTAPFMAHAL